MKESFSKRMLAIMEEKKITQSEISKATGITQSSISDYTRGVYAPKQDKVDQIAKALNVTPAYLMGWEDTPEAEPEIHTIAAHALEELTEEEQEKVLEYAKFIKATRSKNEK